MQPKAKFAINPDTEEIDPSTLNPKESQLIIWCLANNIDVWMEADGKWSIEHTAIDGVMQGVLLEPLVNEVCNKIGILTPDEIRTIKNAINERKTKQ